MRNLQRAAHKVYEIKYHIVLVIKYRKDLFLNSSYVEALKSTLLGIESRYYIKSESLGIDEDHIHLLVQAAPRYSPSKVIGIIKSITARELFRLFPVIKAELWGGEFWSDGGYVGTVGEGANADVIRKYIKRQGRKGDQLRLFQFQAAEP